jgi:hypothetical protein
MYNDAQVTRKDLTDADGNSERYVRCVNSTATSQRRFSASGRDVVMMTDETAMKSMVLKYTHRKEGLQHPSSWLPCIRSTSPLGNLPDGKDGNNPRLCGLLDDLAL